MLSLLFGTSRSALREACLRTAVAKIQASPNQRTLLIVPEQAKIDMERDFLMQSNQKGLMMAEVLSFRRLAWRLLGEVGKQPAKSIDALGRSMLIYRVLRDNKNKLHTLGSLADRPGFVGQIDSVLGDLKRYQIDDQQLKNAAQTVTDQALQQKSLDLACVIAGYQRLMTESNLTDSEDDLTRLGEILQHLISLPKNQWPWPWSRLNWLKDADVWITGFGELRDFTPQEDIVLKALADLARSLTVTATADLIPACKEQTEQGTDAFTAGRRTVWRLIHRLPGIQTQQIDRPLNVQARQIRSILRTGLPLPVKDNEKENDRTASQLKLIEAQSIDDEIAWIAGTIRELVQIEGYRYRDITLAVSNLSQYAARLRSVFRTYQIPLFLDVERSLSGTPLMRFILSLMDIDMTGWSRNAVMTCLRSGLTSLNPQEIDRLENVWLARGLFREDLIFHDDRYDACFVEPDLSDLDNSSDETNSQASIPVLESSVLANRDQALQPIRDVLIRLKKDRKVEDKITHISSFLEVYGVAKRLQERADALIASNDTDMAATMVQSWNVFNQILNQMQQIFSGSDVSLKTFRDLIASSIDTATASVIPSAIDQVNIGDLQRSMLRETPILFIVGASAGQFPPTPPPEGLLKDPDRQKLSQTTGHQLPSRARDKSFSDALIMDTLMTQDLKCLYLTAPDNVVSSIFALLSRYFPNAYQRLDERADLMDPRLNAQGPAFRWLLGHQPAPELPALQLLENLLLAAGFERPAMASVAHSVSVETVRALYQKQVVLSVSQLETYAACPFRQFTQRLLSLQQRPEWQPERTVTGILLHGMLEQALRSICSDFEMWQDHPEAFWQRWVDQDLTDAIQRWFIQTIDRYQMHRVLDDGLRASTGRWVKQTIESSLDVMFRQFQKDCYQPAVFEWSFNPERHTALPIPTDLQTEVCLQGKVDRIDHHQDDNGTFFRVIDYKSSQRTVDYDAIYHGLSLQLPLYVAAYAQIHPDFKPGDAAWFTVNRPISWCSDGIIPDPEKLIDRHMKAQRPISLRLSPESLERVCQHAVRMAGGLVRQILSGYFAPCPSRLTGRPIPCQTCLYGAVCQFDRRSGPWRWLEKPHLDSQAGKQRQAREVLLQLIDQTPERNGDAEHETDR